MDNEWRQVGFFAAGLAIGAALCAFAILGTQPQRTRAPAAAAAPPNAMATTFRGAPCPRQVALAVASDKDGHYRLPSDLSGYVGTDTAAFVVMGQEAAAADRVHDAEVAYLMACRVADAFRGAGSIEAADARYHLARHYGTQAARETGAARRGELLRRAEVLYADSQQVYLAGFGNDHEKSRVAAQGLAGVRQTLVRGAPAVPTPAPAAAAPAPVVSQPGTEAQPTAVAQTPAAVDQPVTPVAKPAPRRAAVAAPRPVAPRAVATIAAPRASPSFDCAKAHSRAEQLICSDARLAELDRELGFLHARARSSTRNPWAFRQQHEQEWQWREATCRDRACLLRWYANRRSQLMNEIESG